MQLALGDSDPRKLERQLRKLDDELGLANVHLFPTRLAHQPRLAILFSSFATRTEALAMREQLAQEWSYQAQLRTISGVRAEMRRHDTARVWPK